MSGKLRRKRERLWRGEKMKGKRKRAINQRGRKMGRRGEEGKEREAMSG